MHILIPVFDDPSHPRLQTMLKEKALWCTACEMETELGFLVENRLLRPRYVVSCSRCKRIGPYGRDIHDAVNQWNAPPSLLSSLTKKWAGKRAKPSSFRNHYQQRPFTS